MNRISSLRSSGRKEDGKPPLPGRLAAGFAFILLPLVVLAVLTSLAVEERGPEGAAGVFPVRVLLEGDERDGSACFSVDGAYRVYPGEEVRSYRDPGFTAWGYRLGRAAASLAGDGRIALNGVPLGRGALCLVPERDGTLRVGRRRYPGVLVIETGPKGALRLVNVLDVEKYLAGVLFSEMPSSFPVEALKSQAVAARTYALFMMIHGKGFLRADDRSQVYGGSGSISDSSREIVSATAREVLTFKGRLLPAYFSSTCGGMTARADDVFPYPSPPPLNHNIPCGYCSESPYFRWSVRFSYGEIARKFGLTKKCPRPEVGVTRTDSARRALEVALLDGKGNVLRRLKAETFRRIVNGGRPLGRRMLSTRIDRIVPGMTGIRIDGGGFGHGVGLCQYGARGLARRGKDYRSILGTYYPGCAVAKVSDLPIDGDGGP